MGIEATDVGLVVTTPFYRLLKEVMLLTPKQHQQACDLLHLLRHGREIIAPAPRKDGWA